MSLSLCVWRASSLYLESDTRTFGIWAGWGHLNAFIVSTSTWKMGLQLFFGWLTCWHRCCFSAFLQCSVRSLWWHLKTQLLREVTGFQWLFGSQICINIHRIPFLAYLLSCIHWEMDIRLWMLKPLYSTSKQFSDSSLHLCILRAAVQMWGLSIKVRVLVYKFQSH